MEFENAMPAINVERLLKESASGSHKKLYALAKSTGNGAWYVLGSLAADAGLTKLAEDLFVKSWKKEPPPYSVYSLTQALINNPNLFINPLGKLRSAEQKIGYTDSIRRAKIAVLEASRHNKKLAAEIDNFTGQPWETPVLAAYISKNKEDKHIVPLIEDFIVYCEDPESLAALPKEINGFIRSELEQLRIARIDYSEGNYQKALDGYQQWIAAAKTQPRPATSQQSLLVPVFNEITQAAIKTDTLDIWADQLNEASAGYQGYVRFTGFFESGKMYRSHSEHKKAADAFMNAFESIPRGLQTDRALWYFLRSINSDAALPMDKILAGYDFAVQSWIEAARFTDVLEQFAHLSVQNSDWSSLDSFLDKWHKDLPKINIAQFAYVIAFAIYEGRFKSAYQPRRYLQLAYKSAPYSWWGLRAAGLLGEVPSIDPKTGIEQNQIDDRIAKIYLEWNLNERIAHQIVDNPDNYADSTINQTAKVLALTNPRLGIRVISQLWFRDGFSPSREQLKMFYPIHYSELVVRESIKNNINADVFNGLIRTESAWDFDAISRSGAQGLSQFMPATWEEWERRLKFPKDSDPMDPETNIIFGAAYLDWLIEQKWTTDWMEVLASYNAGGGRVRNWRTQFPRYGNDLFVMSLPIEEPRFYVSKVLSAATLYAYLYKNIAPADFHRAIGLAMPSEGQP